jgi:CheY-like chemotaxis protein
MNTPLLAPVLSMLDEVKLDEGKKAGAPKKKRVLLVDTSARKRELRADVMRKLGIDVDCAADIGEARSWWRADLYDLVLVSMERGPGHRDQFCDDVRGATPPQRLAFLVGEPAFLADLPNELEPLVLAKADEGALSSDVKAALTASLKGLTQRWGILEASRRISAVRSACSARSRAMQDKPVPPRDSDSRPAKRSATQAMTLDDLLREEMQ